MDIWDLKPGATDRRPVQADQHQPATCRSASTCRMTAKQMHHLADRPLDEHPRSRPQPRPLLHAHRLRAQPEHRAPQLRLGHRARAGRASVPDLEIPPFVSVGGGSVGPGFLGMTCAPFVVGTNGHVRNLNMGIDDDRLDAADGRCSASLEKGFIAQNRGASADGPRQDPGEDAQPDDQQADGGLQGQQGAARKCRDRVRQPTASAAAA